jgi:hypothetical protein
MQHIILYSEIIALIAGLFVLKHIRPPHRKLIVLLLGMTVCVELYAWIHKTFFADRFFVPRLYNIVLPVQFGFYSYVFFKEIRSGVWRKILLLLTCGFLVFVLGVLVIQQPQQFSAVNYSAGVILITLYSLRYIYEQLPGDRVLHIWNNLLFYVAGGILIFYPGTLPLHTLRAYIFANYPAMFETYYYIFLVLGCVMYLLFVFGFYKSTQKRGGIVN